MLSYHEPEWSAAEVSSDPVSRHPNNLQMTCFPIPSTRRARSLTVQYSSFVFVHVIIFCSLPIGNSRSLFNLNLNCAVHIGWKGNINEQKRNDYPFIQSFSLLPARSSVSHASGSLVCFPCIFLYETVGWGAGREGQKKTSENFYLASI